MICRHLLIATLVAALLCTCAVASDGESLCRGECVACMTTHKRIVSALIGIREASKAAMPPERVEPSGPTRQQFVAVTLMADVPDDTVLG